METLVLHTRQGTLHIDETGLLLPRRFNGPYRVPWALVIGADCSAPDHLLLNSGAHGLSRHWPSWWAALAASLGHDRSAQPVILRIAVVQPLDNFHARSLTPLSDSVPGRYSVDRLPNAHPAPAAWPQPSPSAMPSHPASGTGCTAQTSTQGRIHRSGTAAFRRIRMRVLSYSLCSGQPPLRLDDGGAADGQSLFEMLLRTVGAIRHRALGRAPQDRYASSTQHARKLLVLCNPHSGHGTAVRIWKRRMEPMLWFSGLGYTYISTKHAGHAIELGKSYDAALYEGVCCISGDGMVQEFVSGLLSRPDWRTLVRRVPIASVACGTANVLAVGLRTSQPEYATYTILKRRLRPMDAILVSNGAGLRTVSLCGIGWGIPADIAASSEDTRWLGTARYAWLKLKYGLSVMLGRTTHVARLEYSADVAMDDVALAAHFAQLELPAAAKAEPSTRRARAEAEHRSSQAPGEDSGEGGGTRGDAIDVALHSYTAGHGIVAEGGSGGQGQGSVQAQDKLSGRTERRMTLVDSVAVLSVDSTTVAAYSRGDATSAAAAAATAVHLASRSGPTDRGIGQVLGKDSLPQAVLAAVIAQASIHPPEGRWDGDRCSTGSTDGGGGGRAAATFKDCQVKGGRQWAEYCADTRGTSITAGPTPTTAPVAQKRGSVETSSACGAVLPAGGPPQDGQGGQRAGQATCEGDQAAVPRRPPHDRNALASVLPRDFSDSAWTGVQGMGGEAGTAVVRTRIQSTDVGGVTNVSEPTAKLMLRLQKGGEAVAADGRHESSAPTNSRHEGPPSTNPAATVSLFPATADSGLGSLSTCAMVGCSVCEAQGRLRYIGHRRQAVLLRHEEHRARQAERAKTQPTATRHTSVQPSGLLPDCTSSKQPLAPVLEEGSHPGTANHSTHSAQPPAVLVQCTRPPGSLDSAGSDIQTCTTMGPLTAFGPPGSHSEAFPPTRALTGDVGRIGFTSTSPLRQSPRVAAVTSAAPRPCSDPIEHSGPGPGLLRTLRVQRFESSPTADRAQGRGWATPLATPQAVAAAAQADLCTDRTTSAGAPAPTAAGPSSRSIGASWVAAVRNHLPSPVGSLRRTPLSSVRALGAPAGADGRTQGGAAVVGSVHSPGAQSVVGAGVGLGLGLRISRGSMVEQDFPHVWQNLTHVVLKEEDHSTDGGGGGGGGGTPEQTQPAVPLTSQRVQASTRLAPASPGSSLDVSLPRCVGWSRRGFPKFGEQGHYAAIGCINVGPDGAYTHPSDGYMDLVIARKGTASATVGLLGRYVAGSLLCGVTDERISPLFGYIKARSVTLTPVPKGGGEGRDGMRGVQEGPGSRVCNVDGEVFPGPGPFRMHLMPSMLTMYGEV